MRHSFCYRKSVGDSIPHSEVCSPHLTAGPVCALAPTVPPKVWCSLAILVWAAHHMCLTCKPHATHTHPYRHHPRGTDLAPCVSKLAHFTRCREESYIGTIGDSEWASLVGAQVASPQPREGLWPACGARSPCRRSRRRTVLFLPKFWVQAARSPAAPGPKVNFTGSEVLPPLLYKLL